MEIFKPKIETIKHLVVFLAENRVARFKGLGIEVEMYQNLYQDLPQEQTAEEPEISNAQLQQDYMMRRTG